MQKYVVRVYASRQRSCVKLLTLETIKRFLAMRPKYVNLYYRDEVAELLAK